MIFLFRYGFWLHLTYPRLRLWYVRRGTGFAFTPPTFAGVLGCVCARALRLFPANSGQSLGRVALGPAFGLYPANLGWGLRCVCACLGFKLGFTRLILAGPLGCVCLFAPSACTPQIQAGVCGACVWVQVLASSCKFLPEFLVGVSRFGFCFQPANSGMGVRVCVCVRALPVPRKFWPGSGARCLGCGVLALSRELGLGFGMWVCVFGFGIGLHPANPGWAVRVCVFVCALCVYSADPGWGLRCLCLGARFGFTSQILAGVRGGCVSFPILLSTSQFWHGCWAVCVCVRALPVSCHSWLRLVVCVTGFGFCFHPTNPGWGIGV